MNVERFMTTGYAALTIVCVLILISLTDYLTGLV